MFSYVYVKTIFIFKKNSVSFCPGWGVSQHASGYGVCIPACTWAGGVYLSMHMSGVCVWMFGGVWGLWLGVWTGGVWTGRGMYIPRTHPETATEAGGSIRLECILVHFECAVMDFYRAINVAW